MALGLGQEIYKISPENFIVPEVRKKKNQWRDVKGSQEPTESVPKG